MTSFTLTSYETNVGLYDCIPCSLFFLAKLPSDVPGSVDKVD